MAAAQGDASSASVAIGDTWTVEIVTHIPAYEADDMGLQLTVISLEGTQQAFQLQASAEPESVPRQGAGNRDLPGRKDKFVIKLPAGFEPAAVLVLDKEDAGCKIFQKGGKFSELFLKCLTLSSSSSSSISFLANTYISTERGARQFVRDDALSNSALAGNKLLATLMADELLELRGEGKNREYARTNPRKGSDRIYRYAIYNDLGGDVTGDKHKGHIRQSLGGSSEFPYPRRLDTNRGNYEGTAYEQAPDAADATLVTPGVSRSVAAGFAGRLLPPFRALLLGGVRKAQLDVGLAATPWLPQDDNFSTDKTRGFIGGAVAGILPGVLTAIDAAVGSRLPLARRLLRRLGLIPGSEFVSVGDVLSLYDKSEVARLAEGGEMAAVVPTGGGSFGAQLGGIGAGRVDRRTGKAATGGDSVLDVLKYDVPRSLDGRLSTWHTDEEMGRLFLAGQNPMVLQVLGQDRVQQLLQGSKGIAEAEPSIMGLLGNRSMLEVAAAAGEPRLFIVDYWAVHGLLDTLEAANAGSDRVMHAGRCVLFRRPKDNQLVPVVIELAASSKEEPVTYTPNDPAAVWQVAKVIFQSVDSVWHQLVSHWLRTHACVEPFLIATRRRLPAAHPMFRLLMPHFRYTLAINAAARGALVNAGGVIESSFSPGPFSMQLSSIVYGMTWRFKEEGLTADLQKRGFLDGKGELRVGDYPYAEDGLLLWGALQRYFTSYVRLYYANDDAVKKDAWLQAWWHEVKTEAHPEAPADGWMDLDGRSNLVLAALTIAWVASAHHAAVNFGQYDYSGWMPSHSSMCRKAAPAKGSDAWQKLAAQELSSSEMFGYIAQPATATKVMSTVKLLSAHAQDEQYLSTDAQDWLPLESDSAVKEVFEAFIKEITQEVEPEIERRNADPSNTSRNPAGHGLPYTLLYPSSGPGVTMKGVPYSISI